MNSTTDQPNDPVLVCAGLTKRYGDAFAVDDVSLEVRRGEIFGLLGGNGAGKTTTVECAQGLRRPDAGQVRVLGLDPIADASRLRGRVGSQLQESGLPDRMRVSEAVGLFADTPSQARRTMTDWDLGPIAGSAFGALSGGQRQRLFLALALLNEPEVVFLDELTQGLDPSARTEVWSLVERVRDRGTTVVLVTHFTEEAEALCDRVVVMRQGSVVDHGTPSELIGRHGGGVRMRFEASIEDLEWIRLVPEVSGVEQDRAEVEVRGTSRMIVTLGAELVARGRIPDVRVAQPSLDEALLSLLAREAVAR